MIGEIDAFRLLHLYSNLRRERLKAVPPELKLVQSGQRWVDYRCCFSVKACPALANQQAKGEKLQVSTSKLGDVHEMLAKNHQKPSII